MQRIKLAQCNSAVPVCGFQTRVINTTSVILWDEDRGILHITERAGKNKKVVIPITAVHFMELLSDEEIQREEALAAKKLEKPAAAKPTPEATKFDDRRVFRKVNGQIVEMSVEEALEFDTRPPSADPFDGADDEETDE